MKGFFEESLIQTGRPVDSLAPKCGACGLYRSCESPKLGVQGRGVEKVMIVVDFPSKDDDETGSFLSGHWGDYVRKAMKEIGADLDRDAWVTGSLICHPSSAQKGDSKAVSYCRPNLADAIKVHEPLVVLTLGRLALESVLMPYWKDIGPLERWVGWTIPIQDHWVCPTYSPFQLIKADNSLMHRLFLDHLEAAFELDQPPEPQSEFAQEVDIIYDDEEAYDHIKEIHQRGGWIAVDYETNCLKPDYERAEIVSCALSNGAQTISFPWAGKAIRGVGKLLASERTRKIAANLKFEERWTWQEFDHGVANWGWDTMLAAHCLDNRQGICSLKFQSLVQMGVPVYNEAVEPFLSSDGDSHYNRVKDMEIKTLLHYGGMDALLEYRLAHIQRKKMGYGS